MPAPNLDEMGRGALERFAATAVAVDLFPGQKGAELAATKLRLYASLRAAYILSCAAKNVGEAYHQRLKLESMKRRLPKWARWW